MNAPETSQSGYYVVVRYPDLDGALAAAGRLSRKYGPAFAVAHDDGGFPGNTHSHAVVSYGPEYLNN